MATNNLSEFAEFLADRKLVPVKHISYYVGWVEQYLAYAQSHQEVPESLRIAGFLAAVKKRDVQDWQVLQAETAIKIYGEQFQNNVPVPTSTDGLSARMNDRYDYSIILRKMQEAIRLKHYSYSTERSYLDWARRFYEYVIDVRHKDLSEAPLNEEAFG